MNGYYPGALVWRLGQGILGAFDLNSLNLTWNATRSFSEPCHNRLMGDSGESSRFCCGACEHVELAARSGGSYVASPPVIAGTGGAVLMIYSRGQMSSITLEPGTRLTIGKAPGNGIQLDDPFLDRRASELEITATGEVYISDLDSTCGTVVNDTKINRRWRLHEKDTIRLGSSGLFFGRS
jgi:hypothetical protein